MSDEQLSPPERLALVALMVAAREVTNKELTAIAGMELSGARRRRLNDLKLVTSEKKGQSFSHELTDLGWTRCLEEPNGPLPQRSGPYARVLFALLPTLQRFLGRSGVPISEVFTPAAETTDTDLGKAIRDAYWALTAGPRDPVRLSALRERLAGVESSAVDNALRELAEQPGVYLREEANQQKLTAADRAAALRLGGQDRHNLQIEAP